MEDAKQLAYHPSVGKRAVTIEGEDFKPSGVVTGGEGGICARFLSQLRLSQHGNFGFEATSRAPQSREGPE